LETVERLSGERGKSADRALTVGEMSAVQDVLATVRAEAEALTRQISALSSEASVLTRSISDARTQLAALRSGQEVLKTKVAAAAAVDAPGLTSATITGDPAEEDHNAVIADLGVLRQFLLNLKAALK